METWKQWQPDAFATWGILLTCITLYALHRFYRWTYSAYLIRTSYKDIPSLPRHPIWGNLVNAGERLRPSLRRHPDYGFEEIWHELGDPGCFLVDLAPVEDHAFLIIAEPQYIEAFVNPSESFKYSMPKSETYEFIKPLIGPESMVTQEGEAWKALRKRFNPGFQPKYIHSLSGSIISKTEIFVRRLQLAAEKRIVFKLGTYAQDLTQDIITELVIAKNFNAQTTPDGQGEKSPLGILTVNRRLSSLCYVAGLGVGLHMIDPIRPLKAAFYEWWLRRKLTAIVRESISSKDNTNGSRCITQLAVSGMQPTDSLVHSCVDQVKSFLFAGQDTTSTLIQWLCYEMSKSVHSPQHAQALSRLRLEHDTVFGPGPFSALQVLAESHPTGSESIINSRLPYTRAFLKETLRLHPPAATIRVVPKNAPIMTLSLPSGTVSIAGLRMYPAQYLIHRNHKIWGPDALEFKPDRWLDNAYMSKMPPGAFRPFERGPRNCIGQELAMLEGMIVLVAVARAFVFEKAGLTGQTVLDNGEKEKEVWSEYAVTSVPVDGMEMRVSMSA
ncbi:hypothetical protein Q7P37_010577 [Cladosporium fusiforme]